MVPVKIRRKTSMEFPQSIKQQALIRSRGKCECQRTTHQHSGRCNVEFGSNWYVHSKTSMRSKEDISLVNSEVLCLTCHSARQMVAAL